MIEAKTRLEFDKILERIAHHASFSMGKDRVLNSEPSFSTLIVNRELKRLKAAMLLLVEQGPLTFGGISDVSFPLDRSNKGAVLTVEELVDVGRFINGSHRLKKQYEGFDKQYEALDDLFESIVVLDNLAKVIQKSFGEGGEVLDSASSSLRDIRHEIRQIEGQIDRQTQSFLNKHKDALVEQVVTLYHGRRAFLINPRDKYKFSGTILGESASGQSVYFEPQFLNTLQNKLQALRNQEKDEIERICAMISHMIGSESAQILANLETCAILDSLFARAHWGNLNDGVVAKVTEDSLHIVNARHPLIDKDEVVPNTYTLKPPHRMILISGPNTGGKSVTLKTIGLFVMMTLSGVPILADEAEVMMVDNIFVDIGDQQSIEKSLSSFSAHLKTISEVIDSATSNSLVLLDELGSQTDPLEGESLSMAILDHFRSVGTWVVATTHFSRLKKYGTQYDDILIASVEFDLDDLLPTYRYRENVLGESNALSIAKRLGISLDIVKKAEAYKAESTYEEDHLLEILEKRIKENEVLRDRLIQEKEALELKIMDERTRLEDLEEEIKTEKRMWLKARELEFEEKLDTLERKILEMDKMVKPTERHQVLKEVEALKPKTIVEPIHVKDHVKIKQSSQVGIVEKIEKDVAFVSVGALTLQVKLKDLIRLNNPKKTKKAVRKSHKVDRSAKVPLEINVIGLTVDEALPIVDKYLDDCVLHNLASCRIVHGMGTGRLRSEIHKMLRSHKQIESFEAADFNLGATRVVFKR